MQRLLSAMVVENGYENGSTSSTPSPSALDADASDYTSLKRSLSRVYNPSKPTTPVPSALNLSGHDLRARKNATSNAMHLDIPQRPLPAETALAALHHLPTPLLVLSSLKTIVLANEAMGRLLSLRDHEDMADPMKEPITELLRGQTLSQIGIDMISDGVPIWYVDHIHC